MPTKRFHWLLWLAAGGGIALVLWQNWPAITGTLSDRSRLDAWLVGLGPFGPLAIILIQVTQIVIAPIPGQLIGAAAGYVYGFWEGLALNIVGGTLGAITAISLGRLFGRPLVMRFAHDRVIEFVGKFSKVRSVMVWIVIFALPIGDPLLFASGLTQVGLTKLILAAVWGRLPSQVLATLTGSESAAFGVAATVAGLTVGGVLSYLFYRRQQQFEAKALALAEQPIRDD